MTYLDSTPEPRSTRRERAGVVFPIKFWMHPTIVPLSDKAFRVFVEMNARARVQRNDGIFEQRDAEWMWGVKPLKELVESHPTRPLVVRTEHDYVIRQYAKHQGTEARRAQRPHIANATRRAVMDRDGHQCVFCGATDRLELDHIVRFREGGQDTISNLRVLCKPCNVRRR